MILPDPRFELLQCYNVSITEADMMACFRLRRY